MAFEHLIYPIKKSDFFSNYFEKKYLHIQRFDDPAYYDDILNLEDIDEFLQRDDLINTDYATVKEGKKTLHPHKLKINKFYITNLPILLNAFTKEKETIILNHLYKHVEKLGRFIRSLNKEYPLGFGANVYITPPNSQGFDVHYDGHDVYILQLFGQKEWTVYEPVVELPDDTIKIPKAIIDKEKITAELTVSAGDLLFLPRGVPHYAKTNDLPSVHITIGAYQPNRGQELANTLMTETLKDIFFRKSVFHLSEEELVNYSKEFKEKLHLIIDELSVKEALEELIFSKSRFLVGHTNRRSLSDILKNGEIEISRDSRFEKRKYTKVKTINKGKFLLVIINNKQHSYPIFLKPIFDFILKSEPFTVQDIQKELKTSEKGAIQLLNKIRKIDLIRVI